MLLDRRVQRAASLLRTREIYRNAASPRITPLTPALHSWAACRSWQAAWQAAWLAAWRAAAARCRARRARGSRPERDR
eukprot:scaffold17166_cov69-Phaeocystis_antarctica.AAC.2